MQSGDHGDALIRTQGRVAQRELLRVVLSTRNGAANPERDARRKKTGHRENLTPRGQFYLHSDYFLNSFGRFRIALAPWFS